MQILGVHLLDDFSGAARIFSDVLSTLQRAGYKVDILISDHGREGFIRRNHQGVQLFWYVRSGVSRWATLFNYVVSQFFLFFKTLKLFRSCRVDTLYVNTLMPVGAILAARLFGRPVVVHVHETSLSPPLLQSGLTWITKRCATRTIAVSEFTKSKLALGERCRVVYNSLGDDFWQRASVVSDTSYEKRNSGRPCVFMACSLKGYKGVDTFLRLCDASRSSNDILWRLALNCERQDYEWFCAGNRRDNLEVLHRPENISGLYADAHAVLNLSNPDLWLETFGLTLLEGMAHGCVAIGPAYGGVPELILPGFGGQLVDPRRPKEVLDAIVRLVSSPVAWQAQSREAVKRAYQFDQTTFDDGIRAAVAGLRS